MPVSREAVRSALGILGNVASCAFFLSSAPSTYAIIRAKSTGGLSGHLLVMKLLNCLLWVLYGMPLVQPGNFWVLLTNSFGSVFVVLYLLPYLYYASSTQKFKIISELSVFLSLFVLLVLLTFLLRHSRDEKVMVIGILCAIVSTLMHLMLLSQMRKAFQTKEIKYMLPYSSTLGFFKGAVWLAYGLVNLDMYIMIPNGIGTVIGGTQIILLMIVIHSKGNTIKSIEQSIITQDPNKVSKSMDQSTRKQDLNKSSMEANVYDQL